MDYLEPDLAFPLQPAVFPAPSNDLALLPSSSKEEKQSKQDWESEARFQQGEAKRWKEQAERWAKIGQRAQQVICILLQRQPTGPGAIIQRAEFRDDWVLKESQGTDGSYQIWTYAKDDRNQNAQKQALRDGQKGE